MDYQILEMLSRLSEWLILLILSCNHGNKPTDDKVEKLDPVLYNTDIIYSSDV